MNNIKYKLVLFSALTLFFTVNANAYRTPDEKQGNSPLNLGKNAAAGCLEPSSSTELNVNNVRALIHSGGDMWWDLIANARYEIPNGSGRNSLFVGNLWIGGVDGSTNTLKVAAQRYRANGVDYWTGPLDILGTAEIDAATCNLYDQIWEISREVVARFRLCMCTPGGDADPSCDVPAGYYDPIYNWPGNPLVQPGGQHLNMAPKLAPFYDANNDGEYNPKDDCDYPFYDLDNAIDCKVDRSAFLYGDYTLWWVFNDKGNIHGESQGNPIGMEIQAQAFAFNTTDEINNMTFYNYELTNRGTSTLAQCYFGVNTDADIGGATDDYVGCNVSDGFGFMYNGDANDEAFSGQLGYGINPPAIGIDFFEGPYMDSSGVAEIFSDTTTFIDFASLADTSRIHPSFGINGLGFDDTIVDNERIGMRRFVYYSGIGAQGPTGDPSTAIEYYNYLRGRWLDGSRMVYGGNGYPGVQGSTTTPADFMFPGSSDPFNWGTKGVEPGFDWTETNTGAGDNQPADRRFVQSSGPFTLKPGAVNDITVGAVWARTTNGDPFESVILVQAADQKAQLLFENCFRVLNGPDAPTLHIRELDQELILYITNSTISNNYLEEYQEDNYLLPDSNITTTIVTTDSTFFVPSFVILYDSQGDPIFTYNDTVNSIPADTLIFITDTSNNPVDTLFGYFNNQSTSVTTTVVTDTQTTVEVYNTIIDFEGYLIYQVKDSTITATDIFSETGSSVARLVAQCDVRNFDEQGNPIDKLVNYTIDGETGLTFPQVMVDGSNEGIVHSFNITEDEFALEDPTLVNFKSYYYIALAYGYNNFKEYDPDDPLKLDGQKTPFFLGRRNISVYTGVPHIVGPQYGGTQLNSLYGSGPQITRIEGHGNGGNFLELTDASEDSILLSPDGFQETITYEGGFGPVDIKVIDPLAIRGGDYILKFINTSPAGDGRIQDSSYWVLLQPGSPLGDTVAVAEKSLATPYEQIVYDQRDLPESVDPFMGFSITAEQVNGIGPHMAPNSNCTFVLPPVYEDQNGILGSSITFENELQPWLGFFEDQNINSPLNWLRSGSLKSANPPNSLYNSTFVYNYTNCNPVADEFNAFVDPQQFFARNITFFGGGGIVPYILTASGPLTVPPNSQPGHPLRTPNLLADDIQENLDNIYSIDIVLTPDKSKWTRCPVFETNTDDTLAYVSDEYPGSPSTGPSQFTLRASPSVDKDGNPADVSAGASSDPASPNYISPWGMGWFPGYAINVATGERLNIAFGEDSYLTAANGRDMIFNPATADPTQDIENYVSQFGDIIFGGKHFIYVFGSMRSYLPLNAPIIPNYDEGRFIIDTLTGANYVPKFNVSIFTENQVWRSCMWAGIPFHVRGSQWLSGEAKIRLRVAHPYKEGYTENRDAANPQNNNSPMYQFSMDNLAVQNNDTLVAKSMLDLIRVVPSPYYAVSGYEVDQLDNRVRITNLPDRCTISIYTLSGTLIRRLEKGTDAVTYVDWDMKNFDDIPIASGLYIYHIQAPGLGERIIKWFCIMRPVDLNTF